MDLADGRVGRGPYGVGVLELPDFVTPTGDSLDGGRLQATGDFPSGDLSGERSLLVLVLALCGMKNAKPPFARRAWPILAGFS